MTEAEWLDWRGDPGKLLSVVRDRVSERQLRLFACACCRRIWPHLTDERSRVAVAVAEDFADDLGIMERLEQAHAAAAEASIAAAAGGIFTPAEHSAVAACYCTKKYGIICFAAANRAACSLQDSKDSEQQVQCSLFRDILGNPFRRSRLRLNWFGGDAVRKMAQAIYSERRFDRMPELADALERTGCINADALEHCRSEGPHVRGCWVIDLLLGKE